jgi:galacturan 1,4-alpha-galacturonidase
MKLLSLLVLALWNLHPALAKSCDVEVPDATLPSLPSKFTKTCSLKPLGAGRDDTPQILSAISKCGTNGQTTFSPGQYNITSKMTWNLNRAVVNMDGAFLNFNPDVTYWLNPDNTYRVIFIQNQASWFVLTGQDFEVNGFGNGGIQGNGQVPSILL